MNKKELHKKLIKDIQDIYSIANRFENPEQIHPLNIDLALSKVRNLYELLLSINPQTSYNPEYQKKEISTISKVQKEIIEPNTAHEVKISNELLAESKESKENLQQEIHEPELIIETPTKEEVINEITTPSEEKGVEPKHNNDSREIIADKFQSENFNDNIAKKNIKKDVSAKMQSKPINDINSAIGLNDKFIFVRELFSGDKDHYLETIQVLNNFDTFENAIDFLNENFDWKNDNPNYMRLQELVRRKYS